MKFKIGENKMRNKTPRMLALIGLTLSAVGISHASAPSPSNLLQAKELALCAAKKNPIERLSCFDDLAKKYGQAPTTQSTTPTGSGSWTTYTDKDPLTDKEIYYAILEARDGRGQFGDKISLIVRCKNKKTEAYINWNTFLGSDGISVTTRVEKSQAQKQYWGISTDHKASFMPQPAATLKSLVNSTTFVANVTPYGESPLTAIFDVSGAKDAFIDIRKGCNW